MIQEDMPGYYSTHVAVDRGPDRYDYSIGIESASGDIRIMTSDEPHMIYLPEAVIAAIIQLRRHLSDLALTSMVDDQRTSRERSRPIR